MTVRCSTFETNSSSVHALAAIDAGTLELWRGGALLDMEGLEESDYGGADEVRDASGRLIDRKDVPERGCYDAKYQHAKFPYEVFCDVTAGDVPAGDFDAPMPDSDLLVAEIVPYADDEGHVALVRADWYEW